MSLRWRTFLAAGAAAVAFAGCGGDEGPQIPRDESEALRLALQDVKRQLGSADGCSTLQSDTLPALDARVADLPNDLDDNVRETVEDGVERLNELVEEECAGEEDEEPEETQTEDTEPETVPTLPPETEPPPTETEEEPPPTQEEPPPEEEIPEEPGSGGAPGPPGQEKKDKDG